MRAKRKRMTTIDTTSESEEVVAVVEEPVRVANGLTYGTESSRRDNQEPNGPSMCRQDSGLFARKSPALNDHSSEDQFDLLVYGQTDAPRPPLGSLFDRGGSGRPRQGSSSSSSRSRSAAPCLHI